MKMTELYYRAAGHMGQDEDWYYLIEHDDGTFHIRHEWHHTDVKTGKTREGKNDQPLDLSNLQDLPGSARAKLKDILGV